MLPGTPGENRNFQHGRVAIDCSSRSSQKTQPDRHEMEVVWAPVEYE